MLRSFKRPPSYIQGVHGLTRLREPEKYPLATSDNLRSLIRTIWQVKHIEA